MIVSLLAHPGCAMTTCLMRFDVRSHVRIATGETTSVFSGVTDALPKTLAYDLLHVAL